MATTPLPIPPNTLRPETFSSEMDSFLGALPVFQEELNTAGSAAGLALIGNSTTSMAVGTGSKSFTASTGCAFIAGQEVFIASSASPTNRMVGLVTSYDSGTGAMVVNVLTSTGSGTFTVTWPTMTWAWGSAPSLPTSGKACIVLFQVAGTLYGVYAGSLA